MRTSRSQTTFASLLLASLIGTALPANARSRSAAAPAPRFPAAVSERLFEELMKAGSVDLLPDPRDTNSSKRWGRATPEQQQRAVRAVVDALTANRPALDVSAAVLAIARVESGFNPYSQNPTSTACGIFQFIRATWESYGVPRERCVDPDVNAWAGVKHLTTMHSAYVRNAIPPTRELPDELQRAEQTYRLLYAYHYHGEASPFAAVGGSVDSQLAAEEGMPYLRRFYSILKRATLAPRPVARRVRARAAVRAPQRPKSAARARKTPQRS